MPRPGYQPPHHPAPQQHRPNQQYRPSQPPHPGQYQGTPHQPVGSRPRNGLGITAVILGPIGILFGLIPLTGFVAIICGIIGGILGAVGISRASKHQATNRGVAITGTILSALALALGIWGVVTVARAVDKLGDDLESIGDDTPASVVEVAAGQPATTPDGLTVTAAPLTPFDAEYLGTFHCSTVTYQNDSQDTISYSGALDWKLQTPQGTVVDSAYTGRDGALESGDLVPGGTVTGDVCFDETGSGQHLLIMEELVALHPDRLTWVNDLP